LRIKSQFILSIIVFALAVLVVSVSLIVENEQLSNINKQEQSANSIQTGASDLGYLSNNFFLYQENATLLEWKTTLISIYNQISILNSTSSQQQALVNKMKTDLGNIALSYSDVVNFLWNSSRNVSVRATPKFQTVWNQTSSEYQALNSDSALLILYIADEATQVRLRITELILVVFGLFGAYFLTNYLITYRRTLKSIFGLKTVTTIIGSGNLEYQIKVTQKDEIGELAIAFNQMTSHLKTVTASKTELSKEITERKNVELELKQTIEKLVSVNEKLGVVGSLTRHDVRNKLSTVTGYAYLLKKKHAEQEDIVEGLSKMEQAVKDSMKIFDFAKMYEQIGMQELTYVDVEKALNEAVALFSGPVPTIINDCQGLTVLADSFLRQLFYNLIDNTIKYGQKTTAIRVYCQKTDEDSLKLIYEDDGVGVPSENKMKLFKEGFSTGGSTGFGLFLTKKMIDVYGWSIVEEGELGKGAKFAISIPKNLFKSPEGYPYSRIDTRSI
jgi:signal transduction histidine kinase